MKQKFLKLLVGLVVVLFTPQLVLAQAPATNDPLPTGAVSDDIQDPYGFKITYQEQADYFDAVSNCETPSLECLVHNVTRFSAIEWIYNIIGSSHRDKLLSQAKALEKNEYAQNRSGGLVGDLSYMIGAMYTHPIASSTTYVADLLDSANIATPAYAQGLGYASLDPILPLWKEFRNLAYLFFVVIFIVIGFLIMLRTKIGGQTAVTAQQAIPKVILSLVFVTFSYAIAGFLIDMMYVSMILLIGIFKENFSGTNVLSYNIINLFGLLWHAGGGVGNIGKNIDISKAFLTGFEDSGSNFGATVVSILGGLLLTLLLSVAVLIGTVKLFFELLKSYATVVISVVTAPLQLMIGALPGQSKVFGNWVKNIIGNLIPFPTVLLIVIMFYKFTDSVDGIRSGGGFNPPFLLNAGSTGALSALMGLAIIVSVADIVKKVKKPFITEGFGDWLAKTAMDNIKSSEAGLPVATATPAALAGAARGVQAEWGEGERDWRKLGRAAIYGANVSGTKGVGGLGRWGKRGFDYGNWLRIRLERLHEGRLLQAEDTDKLLSRAIEEKAGDKKPEPTQSTPPRAEIK